MRRGRLRRRLFRPSASVFYYKARHGKTTEKGDEWRDFAGEKGLYKSGSMFLSVGIRIDLFPLVSPPLK